MNLNSFGKLYNLKESNILDIYNDDNNLYILANFENKMEFIANGCRSDFDDDDNLLFVLYGVKDKIIRNREYIINDFKIDNNLLIIIINNKEYKICCLNIDVIKK